MASFASVTSWKYWASPAQSVRHLAYLRKAGLVEARKDGLWNYYKLTTARNKFHGKLLECLSCCFQDVPELAGDAERLGHTKCTEPGGCRS